MFLCFSDLWMQSWPSPRIHSFLCAGWTWLSIRTLLGLQCTSVWWVMDNLLDDTTTCGLDGAARFIFLHYFWIAPIIGIETQIIKTTVWNCILTLLYCCWLGDLRSSRVWSEDRSSLHSSQQSQQPFCEFEEGVQGYFLAGGDHPLLPASGVP